MTPPKVVKAIWTPPGNKEDEMDRPKLLNCGDQLQLDCPKGSSHGVFRVSVSRLRAAQEIPAGSGRSGLSKSPRFKLVCTLRGSLLSPHKTPHSKRPLSPPPQIANVTGACPKTFTPMTGDVLLPPTPDCSVKINLTAGDDYFLTSQVTNWLGDYVAGWLGGGCSQGGVLLQAKPQPHAPNRHQPAPTGTNRLPNRPPNRPKIPGECGDGMKMLVKVFCPEGAVTTSKLKLGAGISRNPGGVPDADQHTLAGSHNSTKRQSKVKSGAAGVAAAAWGLGAAAVGAAAALAMP